MAPPKKKRESRILKDDNDIMIYNDDTKQFEAPGFTKNWREQNRKKPKKKKWTWHIQEAKSNGFWIFRKNPLDKFANLKFSVSTGIRGGQQFRHPVVVPILRCYINKRW